jgi:N-acetylmuramoyl-L-alanine amidase
MMSSTCLPLLATAPKMRGVMSGLFKHSAMRNLQRALRVLLVVLEIALFTPVSAISAGLPHFPFSGTDYVNIDDWAAANRFQIRWVVPRKELKLTATSPQRIGKGSANNTIQMTFTVDSRKCDFNGTTLWLSRPVGLRSQTPCIAWKDLTTALEPLLFPTKNAAGKKITTICIDPGHGGRDPGNQEGKEMEKKHALLLAKDLSAVLTKAGLKVVMTRSTDTFVELESRVETANRRKADLFVSLHFNSAEDASVSGAEVYCMTPAHESSTNARGEGTQNGAYPANRLDSKNVLFAHSVQKALEKNLNIEDRGIKRARFAVLRSVEMPAVLVEGAFMSNKGDAKKISDPKWRQQLAGAISEGILAYKRLVEP